MKKLIVSMSKIILRKDKLINYYCYFALTGLILTVICLFIFHGDIFSCIFFHDTLDTGMDFFHSIEYTYGRQPYLYWGTVYPPLANLFFYILFRLIPLSDSAQWADTFIDSVVARGTYQDLRVYQAPMILFMAFIILISVLITYIIQIYIKNEKKSMLCSFCMLLSYGILCGFERGNIILLAFLCTMFFVLFRNSENKYVRELSLILLAVAAGIKLYPAIYGVLLLYDKQYKRAIRTVIYGIILFVFPMFAFKEGIHGFSIFFKILFSFSSIDRISIEGFSLTNICNSFALIINENAFNKIDISMYLNAMGKVSAFCCSNSVDWCSLLKNEWKRILACFDCHVSIYHQGLYALNFLLIHLL